MSVYPEYGYENPQGSEYWRKCCINLVYKDPKKKTTVKKVTVETYHSKNKTIYSAPRTNNTYSTYNNNDYNDWLCWAAVSA